MTLQRATKNKIVSSVFTMRVKEAARKGERLAKWCIIKCREIWGFCRTGGNPHCPTPPRSGCQSWLRPTTLTCQWIILSRSGQLLTCSHMSVSRWRVCTHLKEFKSLWKASSFGSWLIWDETGELLCLQLQGSMGLFPGKAWMFLYRDFL